MCGIGGVVRADPRQPVEEEALRRIAAAIRHRGPDGYGLALEPGAGFVSARLAIFDLPRGWQPLSGAESLLVYNGEIYNHAELRAELEARGARFATTCDTEVLLQLLERERAGGLSRLNGQFAFGWWEPESRRLTLARDRFGVRPLHYAELSDGSIVFGSEAKAIFASGELAAGADLEGIDDVFTTWGPRPPRTAFAGVSQLEPGSLLVWEQGQIVERRRWWDPEGPDTAAAAEADLGELLRDSVALRLRADVPVGAYLSGGLDSSLTAALAQQALGGDLRTFSIAFADPRYDERSFQETAAAALATEHHVVEASAPEIAAALPEVIRHAEAPLVRTAPVPLYLLAREVRAQGITVVITGEGADELFWGYDLFKEVALRRLNRSDPDRASELLDGLYPYLTAGGRRRGDAWQRFILDVGADGDDPLASHLTRARATGAVKAFYRDEISAEMGGPEASLQRLRQSLPAGFAKLGEFERAAFLEVKTLLEPYLLAAQGDRVAMAHGVEGRFPFLDHRLYRRSLTLPAERKLAGMTDKVALRELAAELLPEQIAQRPKLPYRAPEIEPFFAPGAPDWVGELLAPEQLRASPFDSKRVAGLLRRCRSGRAQGMREAMAFVGILSTQLWQEAFIGRGITHYPLETADPYVRIERTPTANQEEVL